MPRMIGVRERRDPGSLYDTNRVEAGQRVVFFGDSDQRAGLLKTNMEVPFSLSHEQTFVVLGIGARLIDKTYEEEELLLDHLHIQFQMGDMPQFTILGPHASMLRHVYSKEELAEYHILANEPPSAYERLGDLPSYRAPGWRLIRPVVVPVRQHIQTNVTAGKTLPEAVTMRVHLFGLQTRDVA